MLQAAGLASFDNMISSVSKHEQKSGIDKSDVDNTLVVNSMKTLQLLELGAERDNSDEKARLKKVNKTRYQQKEETFSLEI